MDTISRVRAAECVNAARTAVLARAGVHNPPKSAGDWAFVRLYDALAENIIASGRDNVAVTYRDLAVLASHRGNGKTTTASSLRKPFSANAWRGTLLEIPLNHDGISLALHLRPAGRKGRPLTLRADFTLRGAKVGVEAADPSGLQPILEAVRSAEEIEARLARQTGIARRALEDLRQAGFNHANDLSRWFARRGLRIAPSIIIAILVLALCAATTGAVALIRYIVIHNTFRLAPNRNEQGVLPKGHRLRGDLVRVEPVKGGRIETRLAPGLIIWTLFRDDLRYARRFPDSNFHFEWTITSNGRTTKYTTTIPELKYPYNSGGQPTVVVPAMNVQAIEVRQYEGSITTPDVGQHIVDKEEDRGWISGAACVLPSPGYARGRSSPIDARVLPGRRVRFLIRHGPARVGDAILKFSFGDGTVWTSTEQRWTVSEAPGDAWDRYQTTLEHVYSRPGRYDIRFALFYDMGKGLESPREAIGQVYVDMPPPSVVPVAPRSPFPGYSAFLPPGGTSIEGSFTVHENVPGTKPEFEMVFKTDNGKVAPSQVVAVSLRNDPHLIALGVVPPEDALAGPTYCAHADFGDGRSPQTLAKRYSDLGTFLAGYQEFLRSGVYPITITAHEVSSRKEERVVLRRKLHVSANAPPRVTSE